MIEQVLEIFFAEWVEQQREIKNFLEKTYTAADILPAFDLADRTIRCVDEGTPGGLHSAGSGILLDMDKAVSLVKSASADGITSHEGCGAAALFCRQKGIDPAQADKVARQWAQKLAQAAGMPYKGHIGAEQMTRPAQFHNAVAVYYDGTGQFNPARAKMLPHGFVVSRKYFGAADLELCISIALGDHGFGKLFTRQNPFYVIAVSTNNNAEFAPEKLQAEVQPLLEKYQGRVALVSLVSPV